LRRDGAHRYDVTGGLLVLGAAAALVPGGLEGAPPEEQRIEEQALGVEHPGLVSSLQSSQRELVVGAWLLST